MPSCPWFDEGTVYYLPYTAEDKVVADYANISIFDVGNLNYDDYLLFRRDGYISLYSKTEAGLKYLEECWISEQTEPDRNKLRENFGIPHGEAKKWQEA